MKIYVLCQYCKESLLTVRNIPIGSDMKTVLAEFGWDKADRGYRCEKCKQAENLNTVKA